MSHGCSALFAVDGDTAFGCALQSLPLLGDRHGADLGFDLGPVEIDRQQAVIERGARNLDPFGQHEAALELARGDAAIDEDPVWDRPSACRGR